MSGGTGVKRFIEGQDRGQLILLPECLDDYVGEDNPVRVVEAFIDELDLAALGFAGVESKRVNGAIVEMSVPDGKVCIVKGHVIGVAGWHEPLVLMHDGIGRASIRAAPS
jgi:hypothetical protein